MSRKSLTYTIIAVAGLMLPARQATAQEGVTLTYRPAIAAGVKEQGDIETRSDQILTIAGMPLETHVQTFLKTSQTAVAPTSDGGWKWDGGFTFVQSEMQLPGGIKLSFNSNNPDQVESNDAAAMVVDALKATAKAKWTAETNAEHQITTFEYTNDPLAGVDDLLKGSADPKAIKRANLTDLKRYPADPVKPGDVWKRTEESDLGAGQTLTLDKEYTYVGSESHEGRMQDKVTVKVLSAEYSMDPNSSSPLKITDAKLEVASSGSTYWYDRDAGMYSERSDDVRMKGALTLEVNNQKLPGELDLTIATKVKSQIVAPE